MNLKRIYRLMKKNDLLVKPNVKLKAIRKAHTEKPRPTRPNEWWGIDMTKVMIPRFGWVYVVLVLDWYTKKVVGHYAGIQAKACHWLEALDRAINQQFPDGSRNHQVRLMSDNGCQPTSIGFMKNCRLLGIQQSFTSYNNPKGNADTERMMRTLKEEFAWIHEWNNPFHFINDLGGWINDYNQNYLHSALGYQSPVQFEVNILGNPPLNAA